MCACTYVLCSYGDFYPQNAKERVYAVAMMLFTFIFYGLMLGKFAIILAAYNFRHQRFKNRFAVIRKYLVSVIVAFDRNSCALHVEESLY